MKTANASPTRPTPTQQSLAPTKTIDDKVVKYKGASGADVELSIALTQKYFCPTATPTEAFMFNAWCSHVGLDPWKKECYLVKYGSSPPQHLTSKDAFTRRAEANPRYQGQKAGVVVINNKGELEERLGEIVLDGEELVGGWADVYVSGYVNPISARIGFKERCQYRDGKPQAKWATSPGLMIRKCALVAALREAFPGDVGGMYVPDEMGYEEVPTASSRIDMASAIDIEPSTGEVTAPAQDDFEASFFDQEGK